VNVPPDGLRAIGGPVIDYYRLINSAAYLQKTRQYESAAAKWKQVLELEPDDELAHRNLGNALLLSGHREDAGAHFEKANELHLRAAVEADPASAAALDSLGALLLGAGRVEEAASQFRKAAALDPDSAETRVNLAGALAQQGKLDESLEELRQTLAAKPDYAPAHYHLGLVYSQRGDAPAALREYRRAVELDPRYAEAHISLAEALGALGETAEAVEHWRAGIELDPGDADALRRAAWALATSADPAVRNGADAISFAVRAVEITGGDARTLDTLAAAYAEKERFAEAALTARRALALAGKEGNPKLAEAIEARIGLYEAHRPFREPAPPQP